ncbi:hypothetical protein [Emcibacter sp. SYSU 3D8]|uniref:hypothetical protein n=1 Tax=Emcibacter sp. SYSU 3D8 TaxID=3133969 RepID=UPI0031FE7BE9
MRAIQLPRIGLLIGIAILASATAAAAQDATPDLTGVWSGKVEAGVSQGMQGHESDVAEPTFGNYELTMTLEISRQEGRALMGTWSSPNQKEKIFGVLRRNNSDLVLVDEDSHFNGSLLSPTSMELCLAETHADAMGVWCLLMEKQAP